MANISGQQGAPIDFRTQMVRFIITGVLSGAIDFSLTMLLQYVFGVPHWGAKTVGFIFGTTTAYLINRRWTFNAPPSTARFIAVVGLYALTYAVQVGIYTVLSRVWPEEIFYSAVAFVIAQGTATVINFVVQRLVIFKIK